jgi:hypothetical protein
MATAGPLFVGTGANFNDGGTTAWTNPTNVQGDTTGTAATVSPPANGNTSQRLRASNFGFSIITGATITGIMVEIEQSAANNSRHRWNSVQLLIAGSETGTDLSDASSITTTKGFKTFGSSSELWGLTPSVAQVNNSGFGVSFKIDRNSAQSTTTSLYRARVTITYTPPEVSGSFTADSTLFATVSATATADAVLFGTQSGTFVADSAILKTQSATFTADAELQSGSTTISDDFTADSMLDPYWGDWSETFQNTVAGVGGGVFTANAVLFKTIEATFTADALLLAVSAATFTADAFFVSALTPEYTFTADAVLKKEATATFTADAYLLAVQTFTYAADAVIQKITSASVTADAVLKATLAANFSANSVILKAQAGSFGADAYLLLLTQGTFTADAVIFRTQAAVITADAVILKTGSNAITADALLRLVNSGTFSADAVLISALSGAFTADAVLFATNEGSFTADALIALSNQFLFTADAFLTKTDVVTFTAEAVLLGIIEGTFTASAKLYPKASRRRPAKVEAGSRDHVNPGGANRLGQVSIPRVTPGTGVKRVKSR